MKLATGIAVLVALLAGLLLAIGEHDRWILFNGDAAEEYAAALLQGDVRYRAPDRFSNYTVSAADGYVMFAPNNRSGAIYAYVPEGIASPVEIIDAPGWRGLRKNWYVHDI